LRRDGVRWAFGAGSQAVTYVSQLDEDTYLEHGLSLFTATGKLDFTPGHRSTAGVRYATFDPEPRILRCFSCHSTGSLSLGPKFDVQPAETGVRCETCHGPGQAHATARKPIRNPASMSAAGINDLCGGCHRMPAPPGVAMDWSEPWNVRHQPVYLAESECFERSGGKLSCLTCHDPHAPLEQVSTAYNAKCEGCHSSAHSKAKTDCVACHMPKVSPRAPLRFTNHWIGVYSEGVPLRPRR
jgi:hypothetical protein